MLKHEIPLVTIILPVYNVENFLSICIESVLQQSYINLDIILVDDGATDDSPKICDHYANEDNRIKVIHQQNGGLSSARNSGLNHAKGEYIFFVDSDDCINPKLVELAVREALKRNCKIVQVELELVSSDFKEYALDVCDKYTVLLFNKMESIYNLDEDNPNYSQDIRLVTTVIWSKLYHKSIFEKIRFVDGIRIHEDQMIIHRFLAEADGMCLVSIPLYYYRNNEGSLIRREWKADKLIILDCYKDRLKCALEIAGNEKEKRQLVELIYRRYLICIIKNYGMVMKHMNGKEKKDTLYQILKRFKQEIREGYGINLSKKDKILFTAFLVFPKTCVLLHTQK